MCSSSISDGMYTKLATSKTNNNYNIDYIIIFLELVMLALVNTWEGMCGMGNVE